MKVVATVGDGEALVKAALFHKPDLVVTDLRMPGLDGLKAGQKIKQQLPAIYLIAYINEENDYLFLHLLKSGFDGIMLKRAGKKEIRRVMDMVLKGFEAFCNFSQERVSKLISKGLYNPKKGFVKLLLNVKEISVLKLICEGYTSKEIAERVNLSTRTVEEYREVLKEKTGTSNTAGLVSYAHMQGIVGRDIEN